MVLNVPSAPDSRSAITTLIFWVGLCGLGAGFGLMAIAPGWDEQARLQQQLSHQRRQQQLIQSSVRHLEILKSSLEQDREFATRMAAADLNRPASELIPLSPDLVSNPLQPRPTIPLPDESVSTTPLQRFILNWHPQGIRLYGWLAAGCLLLFSGAPELLRNLAGSWGRFKTSVKNRYQAPEREPSYITKEPVTDFSSDLGNRPSPVPVRPPHSRPIASAAGDKV